MTIHAAKGLEFENVFITGMEEELFPAAQSVATPQGLEEERRLFYVALTRAAKRVVLSYAASRYRNGQSVSCCKSRFLDDIDAEYLDGYVPMTNEPSSFRMHGQTGGFAGRVTRKPAITLNRTSKVDLPTVDTSRLKPVNAQQVVPEMVVYHPTFGTGKVVDIEGIGMQRKAKVMFAEGGIRVLLLKFAKLYIQEN